MSGDSDDPFALSEFLDRRSHDRSKKQPTLGTLEPNEVLADPKNARDESSVQNIYAPRQAADHLEGASPPAAIGDNSGREAFFTFARKAEELERQIASIEAEIDKSAAEATNRLDPLRRAQILAAFDMAKLVDDGTVPASVMDAYIIESGIRRHGNERVPFSALMRAVIASAEIKTGATKSKLKRARASSYASTIDFALAEGWSREQFIVELNWERRKDERHGIEFLAAAGRRRRNAEKAAARAAIDADASEPDAKSDAHQLDRPRTPAEPQQPDLGERILRRLSKIEAKAGNFAVVVFQNAGPGRWQPVRVDGPFSRPVVVSQAPAWPAVVPTRRSRPVRK